MTVDLARLSSAYTLSTRSSSARSVAARSANAREGNFLRALDRWQHPDDGSYWQDATEGFRLQAWQAGRLKIDVACGQTEDIYDWASLTKIVLSVSNAMIEVGEGDLSLRDGLAAWLPEITEGMTAAQLRRLGKPLTVRDVLSHSAGMTWWKPFYRQVLKRAPRDHEEAWAILSDLVICDVRKRMLNGEIAKARQGPAIYSDLDFFLLGEILRRSSMLSIPDQYARIQDRLDLAGTFFHALSKRDLTTGPVARGPAGKSARGSNGVGGFSARPVPQPGVVWHRDRRDRTAPTERDTEWRGRMLKGEVHDENSSSLFGFAPHAGLFGPIGDLSRYGLELRKLTRGDKSRLPEAGSQFLRRSVPRLRGDWALGFMMPTKGSASCGPKFSLSSVGHTGFTGTSLWYDPKRDLLVTILSNRVHPSRKNARFLKLRPALHTLVVDAL